MVGAWASQVELVVKNPPANAGGVSDAVHLWGPLPALLVWQRLVHFKTLAPGDLLRSLGESRVVYVLIYLSFLFWPTRKLLLKCEVRPLGKVICLGGLLGSAPWSSLSPSFPHGRLLGEAIRGPAGRHAPALCPCPAGRARGDAQLPPGLAPLQRLPHAAARE
ncbi:hypothetical protein X798_07577 [Onchocerca flexuosa]|uniref:Uncharacterized protein n=1 Tax=Onchocerca flexuosa TaxID=387005 RepID=A0A238BJS9_9BILA|nr:hypothetical protein X798_07577 [Onchocerca flexuosa]